ncbi:hypothetical protein CRE_08496 [Caenorhabditis remanei]|uniref:Uncharacterized protein n=1 Tax=Caenorhabditis remanei TaxID=31234 RepID=E3N6X9_CAERE|nr:hypothetical protein CRE_08496 [Caenorhabditis remanei]
MDHNQNQIDVGNTTADSDFSFQRAKKCDEVLEMHFQWNTPYCKLHGQRGVPTVCNCPENTLTLSDPEHIPHFLQFLEANGGYAVHNISVKELKVVKAELVTKIEKLNENIVNWKPESGVSMNEYLEELENVEREHDRAELEMRRKEDSLRRGDEDNNDILRHIVLEDSDDSDEEESEDEEYENEDEGFEDGDGISDAENLLV